MIYVPVSFSTEHQLLHHILPKEITATSCFLQANVTVASSTLKYSASAPGSSKASVRRFGHPFRYRFGRILFFAPAYQQIILERQNAEQYLAILKEHKPSHPSLSPYNVLHSLEIAATNSASRCTCNSPETGIVSHVLVSFSMVCLKSKSLTIFHMHIGGGTKASSRQTRGSFAT